MKARSFYIGFSSDSFKITSLPLKVFVLSIAFLIFPVAVNAQAGPCSCKDRSDLVNQLNRANAAMSTAQYFRQAMGEHLSRHISEILDGPNPENTTYKEMIDADISDDVNIVDDSKAGGVYIKTDGSTCEPTVSATSACLKSLGEKIAPAHKSLCERRKSGMGNGRLTVDVYLGGLIDLYNAEIAAISNLLKSIQKTCAFDDWIGTIRYSLVQRNSSKNQKPGVTESVEDTLNIDGMIRLNGKYPLNYWKYPSSWEATGKYDENKESNGPRACKGGVRTAVLDGRYQTKHVFKWDKNGQTSEDTEVSIGEVQAGNKVPIEFRIPKIILKTSGHSNDSYTSTCPKPNGDFDGPAVPWNVEIPLDSQKVSFVGSYFPGNPEKISGSSTLESGKTTVIVTYNLYKLKP